MRRRLTRKGKGKTQKKEACTAREERETEQENNTYTESFSKKGNLRREQLNKTRTTMREEEGERTTAAQIFILLSLSHSCLFSFSSSSSVLFVRLVLVSFRQREEESASSNTQKESSWEPENEARTQPCLVLPLSFKTNGIQAFSFSPSSFAHSLLLRASFTCFSFPFFFCFFFLPPSLPFHRLPCLFEGLSLSLELRSFSHPCC
jgi:hypothetical protein